MNSTELKGHVAMFSANVMWGLMSPLAKFVIIGGAVSSLVVTDMRIFGAMVLFWVASFFRKSEYVPPKDMFRLFLASLLAIVLNQGSFISGVGMTSPVDASIITTSMPLLVMILSAFFLKEPITGKKVLGIAAGASGALLLILGSHQSSETRIVGDNYILGDLLVLFAQFSYACYIVFFKHFVEKYSLFTIMKWMFTYAFICILPFSYMDLMQASWNALTINEVLSLLFIVVCCTFISYVCVVIGQKNLRPTVAGMYNYVQPVVASVIAICWGMDSFNLMKVLSVILIFVGVYLVTKSRSRADMEKMMKQNSEVQ